ncbi:Crp/Fnr family transcriptional regulator [Splendidivirga corallicola]
MTHCTNCTFGWGFCPVKDLQLDPENDGVEFRYYEEGDIIFMEGDRADSFYYLYKQGKVKIYKTDLNNRKVTLRLVRDCQFLGLHAFLGNGFHTNTSKVLEPTLVCKISGKHFETLAANNPILKLNILGRLTKQLELMENKLTALETVQ